MVSAGDIITYIGVPLTAVGVLPIILNAIRSMYIWWRLLTAIPREFRRFFNIIPDPAGGTVSVNFQNVYIDSSTLLGFEPVDIDLAADAAEQQPSDIWWRKRFDKSQHEKARRYKDPFVPLNQKFSVPNTRPDAPSSLWMSLFQSGSMVYAPIYALPYQSIVDSSMRCSPSLLECRWPIFVYLSLGMGVEPLNGLTEIGDLFVRRQTLAYPIKLCNRNREPIMTVSMQDGMVVSRLEAGDKRISLQRMLAWESIMIFEGSDGLLVCVPIGGQRSFLASEIVAFSANGIVFAHDHPVRVKPEVKREITLCLAREEIEIVSRKLLMASVAGKEHRKLEEALPWILYTEKVYEKTGEILPTNASIFLACFGSAMRLHEKLSLERLKGLLDSWGVADVDVDSAASKILEFLDMQTKSDYPIDRERDKVEMFFQSVEYMWKEKIQTRILEKEGPSDPAKDHQHIWNILQKTPPFRAIETSFAPSKYLESLRQRNYEPSSTRNDQEPMDLTSAGGRLTLYWDLDSDYGLMAHLILGLSIILTLPLPYMDKDQAERVQETDSPGSPGSSDDPRFQELSETLLPPPGSPGNPIFQEPLQGLLPRRPVLNDSIFFL